MQIKCEAELEESVAQLGSQELGVGPHVPLICIDCICVCKQFAWPHLGSTSSRIELSSIHAATEHRRANSPFKPG